MVFRVGWPSFSLWYNLPSVPEIAFLQHNSSMPTFTAARMLTPNSEIAYPRMVVEDGHIVEVSARSDGRSLSGASICDFGDGVIVPGCIDLHIHGNAGYDVMDEYAEALPAIERMLSRHGVTGYFPTTVTAPLDSTLRALERFAEAIEGSQQNSDRAGRATPLGVHLEGPFISHVRRGVHPPELLLAPKIETFERFWQAARGHIRMLTIAPELDGAIELIRIAAARGVCVSLGHSDADFSVTENAIAAGASHATHIFNAMRFLPTAALVPTSLSMAFISIPRSLSSLPNARDRKGLCSLPTQPPPLACPRGAITLDRSTSMSGMAPALMTASWRGAF